jgi:ribosomal protein S18 acetylase RimI-like enzyme
MLSAHLLTANEWVLLRDTRLIALKDSPEAFLSTYERELAYGERDWRAEFTRGQWTVEVRQGKAVGLLGATRDAAAPRSECYLEYMWVSPEFRRCGVASSLVTQILRRLQGSGVSTVWLWILDGNEAAQRFYEKCGFTRIHKRQPLPQDLQHYEELMGRSLCGLTGPSSPCAQSVIRLNM